MQTAVIILGILFLIVLVLLIRKESQNQELFKSYSELERDFEHVKKQRESLNIDINKLRQTNEKLNSDINIINNDYEKLEQKALKISTKNAFYVKLLKLLNDNKVKYLWHKVEQKGASLKYNKATGEYSLITPGRLPKDVTDNYIIVIRKQVSGLETDYELSNLIHAVAENEITLKSNIV
jgi:hypothetical protein